MCYEVVLCHLWMDGSEMMNHPFLADAEMWAVPSFFIMSIYFTASTIMNSSGEKLLKRMYRLIMPQIVWTVIYFAYYWIIGTEKGNWDRFWLQLFLGHTFNMTMWYQIDLIIITLLLVLVYFLIPRKTAHLVMTAVCAACFLLQYSGLNYKFFSKYDSAVYYPLGRIVECIPFAFIGLLLYDYDVLEAARKHRIFSMLTCCISLYTLATCNIFYNTYGFDYQSIEWSFAGLFLVILFYVLPFDRLPKEIGSFISYVSSFTMGIYFMHRMMNVVFKRTVAIKAGMSTGTLLYCSIIFGLCWLVSMLISLIPGKFSKQLVK